MAARGWAQIDPFLHPDDAEALARHLESRDDWHQHVNQGPKLFEIPRHVRLGFDKAKREALDAAVYRNASQGFQYRFEGLRVADDRRAWRDDPLHRLAATLNRSDTIAAFARLLGSPDVGFADAQATLYSPGDFLTDHDDDVAGKNRRAAYVFSLTRGWRADWGGLLLLQDNADRADRFTALVPGWNRLTLFRVPRRHSVSLVSPAAPRGRLSVTGWLRAGEPTG
jgi:Rps23 Pro-64 3,4-dihydroxylase Tpa1-like proline 4-hydroxylase